MTRYLQPALVSIVLLAASCEKGDPSGSGGGEITDPAPASQGAPLAVPGPPPAAAAAPAPGTSPEDEAFKKLIAEIAALGDDKILDWHWRNAQVVWEDRQIAGWGTLDLAGSGRPYRVAGLVPECPRLDRDAGEGLIPLSLVVETAPDRRWQIEFQSGRPGVAYLGDPPDRLCAERQRDRAPPPWRVNRDNRLRVEAPHGIDVPTGDFLDIAVRDGELAVIERSQASAGGGACRSNCPRLKGFESSETRSLGLRVYGPFASAAELLRLHGAWSPQRERPEATRANPRFTRAVRALAKAGRLYVSGWGTQRLDGSDRRYPAAALRSIDRLPPEGPESLQDAAKLLVEVAPDKMWQITFPEDSHNRITFGGAGRWLEVEPPWEDLADAGLLISNGSDSYQVGVRDGQLVVVGDSSTPGGTCTPGCPPLRGYPIRSIELTVLGPEPPR